MTGSGRHEVDTLAASGIALILLLLGLGAFSRVPGPGNHVGRGVSSPFRNERLNHGIGCVRGHTNS